MQGCCGSAVGNVDVINVLGAVALRVDGSNPVVVVKFKNHAI